MTDSELQLLLNVFVPSNAQAITVITTAAEVPTHRAHLNGTEFGIPDEVALDLVFRGARQETRTPGAFAFRPNDPQSTLNNPNAVLWSPDLEGIPKK